MASVPQYLKPEESLPSVEHPSGVLIAADDKDWLDDGFLCSTCRGLLEAGCTYFVCFGQRSEEVHDRIDDIIVERTCDGQGYDGVVTTFHSDESEQDVAEFFTHAVLKKLKGALILAQDVEKWAHYF